MSNAKVGSIFQERYLIVQVLGAGGMGAVYRARQLDAERDVALKLLHNEAVANEQSIARFHREFKLLSRLSHPHIMTVYGLALDDKYLPYAVCEFLEGINLRSLLINEKRLEWNRALKIAMQISQAMQYLHEQGIVHRDLKPDNVMLLELPDPDFVKVVDFGLSRVFDGEDSASQKLTSTGQLVGSAMYMSPEQFSDKADSRSDIYSLGCVLFELLSGEILFDSENSAVAIHRHQTEDPAARFASVKTPVPQNIFTLLARMLEKNPDNRVQTMKEVEDELQAVLDEPDTMITGAVYRHRSAKPFSSLWISVAAGILLLLLGTFGFVWWNKQASLRTPNKLADNVKGGSPGTVFGASEDEVRSIVNRKESPFVKCQRLIEFRLQHRADTKVRLLAAKSAYEIASHGLRGTRPDLYYRALREYGHDELKYGNAELGIKLLKPIMLADENNPKINVSPSDIINVKAELSQALLNEGRVPEAVALARRVVAWDWGVSQPTLLQTLGVLLKTNNIEDAKKMMLKTVNTDYLLPMCGMCRSQRQTALCDFCMKRAEESLPKSRFGMFDENYYRFLIEECWIAQTRGEKRKANQLIAQLVAKSREFDKYRSTEPGGADLVYLLRNAGMLDEALRFASKIENPSTRVQLLKADILTMKQDYGEAQKLLTELHRLSDEGEYSGTNLHGPDVIIDPELETKRWASSRLADIIQKKADYRKGLNDWEYDPDRPGSHRLD